MKCAIYIRVSTNKEEQKTSIQNQKDLFLSYVTERGWDIYDIYIDIESGTKDNRTNFQKMMSDAKNRKFDVILAKELSRLARNSKLSHDIKFIAENNNINLITLDNAINTVDNPTAGNFMFGLYATIYEHESKQMSDRIKLALKSRAHRGVFKGSIPPYGYLVKEGKLHIRDDETPKVVKRIFKEYIEGKGFDAIARGLYNDDIPTPSVIACKKYTNDKWHGSSIRCILTNPHYIGDLSQNRTTTRSVTSNIRNIVDTSNQIIVKNTHEAIISKSDFNIVQELISLRKRIRPAAQVHLFSNILFCADCGHKMHFKKNRSGYICGNFNKHGAKACSSHIVREKDLSNILIADFKLLINNLEDKVFIKNIKEYNKRNIKPIEKNLNSLNIKINSLVSKKSKALNKFIEEHITKEDYDMVVNDCNFQIEKLQEDKFLHENTIKNNTSIDIFSNLTNFKIFLLNNNELSTGLLNTLVFKIEIKDDGSPKIHYRFSSSLLNNKIK